MEELTRLQASRKGYKSHVTRINNKIDELLFNECDEFTIASLTTAVEQLNRKKETLSQIDTRITELTESPDDLESVVFEAEETKDAILDKISRVRAFIDRHTHRQLDTTPTPTSMVNDNEPETQDTSPHQSTNTSPINNVTVEGLATTATVTTSTVTSSVATSTVTNPVTPSIMTSTITFPITSSDETTMPHGAFRPISIYPATNITSHFGFGGPPPLIPAVTSMATIYDPSTHESLPAVSTHPFMNTSRHGNSQPVSSQFATSRLPKLTLPSFRGDPLTWQTFWDSFNAAIHAYPSLSEIQKFNYLKAQLQGDAARTIEGLPLTEMNYRHSISLLKERFGQPHKLVSAHMQALLEMPNPTNNLVSLQTFYDSIETHTRGLLSLGKTKDTYGDLLVPIILRKLPVEIRKNLAREHANAEWTMDELRSAILKEIRVFETGLYTANLQTTIPQRSTAAFHVTTFKETTGNTNPRTDGKRNASCVYCKGPHPSHSCEIVTDYQRRLDIVKKGKLCYNCLAHHKVSQCTSKFRCKRCKRKHHTSLCDGGALKSNESSETSKSSEREKNDQKVGDQQTSVVHTALTPASHPGSLCNSTVCLLKTAIAPIIAGDVRKQANILFDEGAQRSFISAEMAAELNIIPTTTEGLALASFGTDSTAHHQLAAATVKLETNSGELIPVSVLIVPSIAAPIQNTVCASLNTMPHLRGLKLANPVVDNEDFKISLLIGTDYYWTFVQDHIVRGNGPTAQESKLGYLLSGPLPYPVDQTTSSVLLQITSASIKPEEPNLEQFWSIEGIGTTLQEEETDTTFLQAYQDRCIFQTPDGMYTAKFPWKEDRPYLPSNLNTCTSRTRALLNKLRQTPELLQIYDGIIKDQEQRGFIEKVDSDITENVHYLPHHPVRKESPTTPIRIVYNCSSRGNRNCASLNDCLMVGPPFLNDLCAILLRFRKHAFALSTDIEKAFLHVKLHESDRNFTRFLWPENPESLDSNLQIYRFKVVPFGSSSSPFMLGAVLNLHLSKYQSLIADDMKKNIYVDNILSGCHTEEEIVNYYVQAREIMNQARFNLRSWSSNSHHLQKLTAKDQTGDTNPTVNILGLRWNTATDTLSLAPRKLIFPNNTLITKREVLQVSSQFYDPLGWATPVTIRAKILLQEIWLSKVSWDEPLSEIMREKWLAILDDILKLPKLIIPRPYFPPSKASSSIHHVYVFSDASTKAYGAVVYICKNNNISLVMSKSRVAPIKSVTLPKLELMAAVMATRLAQFIVSAMNFQCHKIPYNIQFWTDSQIVLYWIFKNSNSKPFVTHRVKEIVKSFPDKVWSYTPSSENPADLLTRGITTQQLLSSQLWSQGPHWLTSKSKWPKWSPTSVLHLQLVDCEDTDTTQDDLCATDNITGIHNVVDISHYSRISKLLAVTSYVLRFIHNVRRQQSKLTGPLTVSEVNRARTLWISSSQNVSYQPEITYLIKKNHKCPTLVRQLRLFLDKDKLLRCGGRIHNAPVNDLTKFPFLLPPKHPFTDMIIRNVHEKLHHGGVGNTVTALRQVYWIPTIRQRVRKQLRLCVICNKLSGKPYRAPDPPPLPKIRVEESKPFAITGVDFTGALYVKAMGGEKKVYICLFTCACTRAVHLEIVTDLSVDTFLLAFRRFASRKSLPNQMISDNASTYLAAAEELRKLFESDALKEALTHQNVTWQFIPKRAPWYGGFWERLIGLTKQAVKKTLGRTFVTLPELETIVVEVEAMLNNRPLTYVSSDLTDPEALTPAHLIYGRRIQSVPHTLEDTEEIMDPPYMDDQRMRNQVNTHSHIIQQFWSRWRKEYLTALREFHRSTGHNEQVINKGDVVMVHDNTSRMQWKLAVVEELIRGNDGFVRAAHIRTDNYRTTRPIVKLYPLEVTSSVNQSQGREEATDHISEISTDANCPAEVDTSSEQPKICRKRNAAIKAMRKIKEWTNVPCCPPEDVEN